MRLEELMRPSASSTSSSSSTSISDALVRVATQSERGVVVVLVVVERAKIHAAVVDRRNGVSGEAGQVRCSPVSVGFRERVWRTGPVLRDLSSHLSLKR